jgi:ABC-2 type transport system ATP-binding protein
MRPPGPNGSPIGRHEIVLAAPSGGIQVCGVSKHFGPNVILERIDLDVGPSEVVALLGPNGAGKSTLLRIMAGSILPDTGTVELAGADVVSEARSARSRTGLVLGEERSFFWRLSGQRNLEFFCALHGMRRREAKITTARTLAAVGLEDVAYRRVDQYSTGMRARLGIARALLGEPSVLLLDEPTRSLDPLSGASVRDLVLNLAADQKVAVLLATHDLAEAARVASRVVILAAGRVAGRIDRPNDAASLERAFRAAVT